MKMKKRILMITPFFRPNIGGVESHLTDLCEYLRERKYYLYIVTFQPLTTKVKAPGFEKLENMEIYRFWWPGYNLFHKLEPYPILEFLYLTPYLFLRCLIFLLLNHQKIDVIHAHGLNAAFIGRFLKMIFKKRAIVSTYAIYNFSPNSFFAKIVAWTLSSFEEIQPLANPSKQELLKIGLPENKMRVYYLWINPGDFKFIQKETAKKIVGLSGKFIVLFVGRLISIKGPELIMEVAKKLPKINFVFIGDGPLAFDLEKKSKDYPNILFAGRVDNARRSEYYCAADIFVLPSLYEEAFGKVAIEALFCGKPVIGSRRGAIPDIITSKVGRVIEPTAENFRREIDELFRHPDKLSWLSQNCRGYAEKKFSEKNAEVIKRGYHE